MNAPAAPMLPPQVVSLELIRTLVGYDTTSRDSNLGLIHWVRDYLARHGIASELTFDDDRRKANLFATLPAQDGNTTAGGIVLSGHTDVVPVDDQPWDTAPFDATITTIKLFDGTLDTITLPAGTKPITVSVAHTSAGDNLAIVGLSVADWELLLAQRRTAKELATRMHGEIRLNARPGRTAFTLELPAGPEQE